MSIKVSVIIPTYNRFKYVLNAINSVKNQTYNTTEENTKLVEIIVVNDGSTQDEYYTFDWKSVGVDKIIHLPQNTKKMFGFPCVGHVRNVGIESSSPDSKYIAFCDDDDIWMPDKLSIQILEMEKKSFQISSTNTLIGKGVFDKEIKYQTYFRENSLPSIWNRHFISSVNYLINSSVVITKDLSLKVGKLKIIKIGEYEDYDYWKRCMDICDCLYISLPLVYYDSGHGDGQNHT